MKHLFKFLIRFVPRHYLIKLSLFFGKIFALLYKGDKYFCPICEHKFRKFLPFGSKGNENRLCPVCLSLERHRLLWIYLKNFTDFFSNKYTVLHIAPEQCFYKRFKKMNNLHYITADLVSPIADVKMDICNMPFENEKFDVVLCNHVLEHILDEKKALSEINRVMKKNAWAVLLVPIDVTRHETYEDPSITDPREREKHFGQYDHVRYHGLDYPDRLRNAGFVVDEIKMFDYLSTEQIEYQRLYKPGEEIIYIARKK